VFVLVTIFVVVGAPKLNKSSSALFPPLDWLADEIDYEEVFGTSILLIKVIKSRLSSF